MTFIILTIMLCLVLKPAKLPSFLIKSILEHLVGQHFVPTRENQTLYSRCQGVLIEPLTLRKA